ncbi:MAG TPA: hypothetical protein VHE35_28335 [Kofleriaceae bacterium]|nr:hypothetical protein [Kofleriaceae bacterium]
MRRAAAIVMTLSVAACAALAGCASIGQAPPAQRGVEALIAALRGNDPHAAYRLLDRATRKRVSFEEFELQWKASPAERAWEADRLDAALRAEPDVDERAAVSYADGRTIGLEREGNRWRLDDALVSRVRAAHPRDALKMFAQAMRAHDLEGVLRTLTIRRREGLAKQIEGFLAGLDRKADGKLEEIGTDRAELRWDENGLRYRIVLRREDDEWRIDDIHILPSTGDDSDTDTNDTPPAQDELF